MSKILTPLLMRYIKWIDAEFYKTYKNNKNSLTEIIQEI